MKKKSKKKGVSVIRAPPTVVRSFLLSSTCSTEFARRSPSEPSVKGKKKEEKNKIHIFFSFLPATGCAPVRPAEHVCTKGGGRTVLSDVAEASNGQGQLYKTKNRATLVLAYTLCFPRPIYPFSTLLISAFLPVIAILI